MKHPSPCLTALLGLAASIFAAFVLTACQTPPAPMQPSPAPPVAVKPAPPAPMPRPSALVRQGDEIVVAGQLFHTGTRVVTWFDAGGYDAYCGEHRAERTAGAKPERQVGATARLTATKSYGEREIAVTAGKSQPIHRADLADLQRVVDQFVLHYDGCGVSRECFTVLGQRNLSVHFLLDLDGTVYQTLDLQERALHATIANDRSVGVEIANVGAFPPTNDKTLTKWYRRDAKGHTTIRVARQVGDPHFLTKKFVARPMRDAPVHGKVQGLSLEQYDFTPEQYAALSKLTAALCRVFPRLTCDYPRDNTGRLITEKLSDEALAKFHGILGHYHIQTNKQDPGPALQWEKVIAGAGAAKQ